MKKILTLVLVSAIGGAITLGVYKLFIEDEKDGAVEVSTSPRIIPVNNTNNAFLTSPESADFTNAAEKTIHTVVHVKNTTVSKGYLTFDDLFFGKPSERAQIGTGSGVVISPDGLIVTNNHVIEGAQDITITTNNNKAYDAELIGADPKTDIAVLKIKSDKDLPYTSFSNSDNAKIGEWVLAVGNPFNLTSTVTAGIISAKSRDLSGRNTQSFIQTDAAVNRGNSGGALVNLNGELIGINTAISSQTGSYIGYSFAVPSNIVKKVVEDILEYGDVQQGILGVTGLALNSNSASEVGVDETKGFYVSDVEEDSGAQRAGIRNGDIIKRLDNVEISKFSDMKGFLGAKRPNDVVNVTVLRNGSEKVIPVTLVKNPNITFPKIGTLREASQNDLKKVGAENGLKVSSLDPDYANYWLRNGVTIGSIIVSINNTEVNTIEDLEQILASRYENDPLQLEIVKENGDRERFNFNNR